MPITSKTNKWEQANRLVVERTSPCRSYTGPIDNEANYFVLMLEQLGAKTAYSCSGHEDCPNNFYIVFEAPARLAEKIVGCGWFTVELEGRKLWSLRTRNIKDNKERRWFLRMAAEAWEKKLGPAEFLQATQNEEENV